MKKEKRQYEISFATVKFDDLIKIVMRTLLVVTGIL